MKLTLTRIAYGVFLLVNYAFRGRILSRGHRFESYRFCKRNVAQLVRASISQKSLRSQHLQIRYHYYPTAVAITIAITITEVPYEGCGSPRFFLYSMKLITITGPSGAGKDTVARMLSEMSGYQVLCSYTTRPKREGEIDGVEHYFVEKCDVPHDKMLAYTQYGGYEYWVTLDQLTNKSIYVIDEDGLQVLCKKFPDIELFKICVSAYESTRLSRGVSRERIGRDKQRKLLPLAFYDAVIFNNGSLSKLRDEVQRVRYMIV